MTKQSSVITLKNEALFAEIDRHGAWLTKLSAEGRDILYPRVSIRGENGKVKVRGGSHVCLPLFGPDERLEHDRLAQHGFGRVLTWDIERQAEHEVTLRLYIDDEKVAALATTQPGTKAYLGLESKLSYRLHGASFTCELQLENHSSQAMRVSPGFHPYFQLFGIRAADVRVTGLDAEPMYVGNANPSYDRELPPHPIEFAVGDGRRMTMTDCGLSTVTFWSDDPDAFVCVEPTFQGPTFIAASTYPENERLPPEQTLQCSFTIEGKF